MRKNHMKRFIVSMIILLLPAQAFAGEAIRFKHGLSVYADDKGVGLKQPEGVACGSDRLAIADTGNSRIVLYSIQEGVPREGKEIRLSQIAYPIRVAQTSKGDLFVVDGRNRKVARLSPEGTFRDYVNLTGLPTEGMVIPAGLGLDSNDNLYLFDVHGSRVLIFSDDGKFQREILLPKESGFITDVAIDSKGTTFLVDSTNATVYSNAKNETVFEPITKKLHDEIKFSSNIAVDNKGLVYITDQNGGNIIVINKEGSIKKFFAMGWKEGTLRYPAQVCISSNGDLYVADRTNNRIQKFKTFQ